MNLLATDSVPAAGTCYRFVVESAEQAATLIRERLGEQARVLSVRSVKGRGWRRLVSSPQLEVIVQIEPAPEIALPAAGEPAPEEPTVATAPSARQLRSDSFKSLPELLRRSGFSDGVLNWLETAPGWADLSAAPLHRAFVEVGRQSGRQAARFLNGVPIEQIPPESPQIKKLTLNLKAAKKLNILLPRQLLCQAHQLCQ